MGSTQQDLLDAVALASSGKLRQVIDRVVPLAQVNETLQALQRGEVTGRAVLPRVAGEGAEQRVVHDVEALDRDLLAILHGGMEQALDDEAFNALALRLFAYQYDANIPYYKYCQRRGQTPNRTALAADSSGADRGVQRAGAQLYTPRAGRSSVDVEWHDQPGETQQALPGTPCHL